MPSSLNGSNVKQGIKTTLKDLFVANKTKEQLKRISLILKNREKLSELQINKSNFLIFEGPSGCGKTYSAHALAGELGIPLIKINSMRFYNPSGINPAVFSTIKRFQNSLVLIDDADKIFGRDALDHNDGDMISSLLNSNFDDLDEGAIVVLSVNDSKRLGTALKDRFTIIKFEHPGDSERESFFEKLISTSKIKFNITNKELSDLTNKGNYRDMQRAWNDLIFYAIENNISELTKDHLNIVFPVNSRSLTPGMVG